jgi:YVTN family beta-propeller protein
MVRSHLLSLFFFHHFIHVFLIIVTFALFIIIFHIPKQAVAQNAAHRIDNNNNINNSLTYTNSGFGITMQYPSKWQESEEGKNNVRFSSLLESRSDNFRENLFIQILPSENTPLDNKVSEDIGKYRQNLTVTDFNITDSRTTSLLGNDARKIEYQYKYGPNFFKAMQLWTIISDKVYVIKYTAELNKYSTYLPIIREIIKSLKIPKHFKTVDIEELDQLGHRIGTDPYSIAINQFTNKMYVTNWRFNTISVIDGSTDTVIDNITNIGEKPGGLAIDPILNRLYVANYGSNTVSVIDTSNDRLVTTISHVGKNPADIAIDTNEVESNNLIFVANYGSNNVSVINGLNYAVVANITNIGEKPSALAIDPVINRLYIANSGSDTISVIDYYFSTKTNKFNAQLVHTIKAAKFPGSIYLDKNTNSLFVANRDSNDVSIIDAASNNILENITVGNSPSGITGTGNPNNDKIYVSNYGSNTVSVIDGNTYNMIDNVTVGRFPTNVYADPNANIVYVTDLGSNRITEINSISNKVLAGVSFKVNPPDSGAIICNGSYVTTYTRYEFGTNLNCDSQPNSNFKFDGWSGTLGSRLGDPATSFKLLGYGTLTANFGRQASFNIPTEYFVSLYALTATVFTGWFVPNIARWINAVRQRNKLTNYIKEIDYANNEPNQNNNIGKLEKLDKIKDSITNSYAKGKLTDSYYQILNNKISFLYEKSYINEINSLYNEQHNDNKKCLDNLDRIRDSITDAYSQGKLTDSHYQILNNKLSDYLKELDNIR